MLTTKEILISARARIEKGWTQGQYARDKQMNGVDEESPKAVCWCISGALLAVVGRGERNLNYWAARDMLQHYTPERRNIIAFNDDIAKSKEDVLALFDKAIAACD